MSRLCVKNLPKHATEDRLREYFSQKGEVTDAKLMRTSDGKSRQFGFVGFRTEKEAAEALKFFNGSFMDTYRITCEIARKVGDQEMPRPWSRHSLQKQKNASVEKKESVPSVTKRRKGTTEVNNDADDSDPQLQEFLQVMQPRSKSKLWSNDMLEAAQGKDGNKQVKVEKEGKKKLKSKSAKLTETDGVERDKTVSDMDYFKSRVKKEWSDSDDDDDDDSMDDDDSHKKHEIQPKTEVEGIEIANETDDVDEPLSSLEDEDDVLQTGRLYVRNLPYTATEDDLREHFSQFGKVAQAHLVLDKDTKRSKGFAYILYVLPESAARALEALDNSIFQGRLLHVMPAKHKIVPVKKDEFADQSKTFKQQREEKKKKAEVSGDTRAWNSLFVRSDTVVESIARELGISKSEFLDREAPDLASRIALGESKVIADTKKALTNAGVNVTSLENIAKSKGLKRSNHVILVKNLPYGSTETELASMFGKFGNIDKIILPSTKTLGLVVFLEPSQARAAFTHLAYRRYKDTLLYLEWAPDDIFSEDQTAVTGEKEASFIGEHEKKRALLEQELEVTTDVDIDTEQNESRSLYVKNLNFKTTDEGLKKHFVDHVKEGKLRSVRIKKHEKNGKHVSMGFGFLEFDTVDTAVHVCRDLQGTVLDGHALILELCRAKNNERGKAKVSDDLSSTKLIVRNVAFEATAKDLRQLFNPFGQIKSLRLPPRMGKHRGFAFVEYVTKQETKNALQALSNTHLYGRHLVLERAKEGESLEELRDRTAAKFVDETNGYQNLTKRSLKRKQFDM
ncbi:multiple RNA-binding domain-containing protein 1 [Rutidosis leptorrhynchoides]|uniref:multiple RNA-binding domain-containing protein 1 n=1 Tax=Rutidosis leptorrhynchoides TaxID=125765 RepID=UPI003A98D7F4